MKLKGAEIVWECLTREGVEEWPELTKQQVAERLAARICDHLAANSAIA